MAEAKSVEDLVMEWPTEKLVGLVMLLTGGSANPSVVAAQVWRIKEKNEWPTA